MLTSKSYNLADKESTVDFKFKNKNKNITSCQIQGETNKFTFLLGVIWSFNPNHSPTPASFSCTLTSPIYMNHSKNWNSDTSPFCHHTIIENIKQRIEHLYWADILDSLLSLLLMSKMYVLYRGYALNDLFSYLDLFYRDWSKFLNFQICNILKFKVSCFFFWKSKKKYFKHFLTNWNWKSKEP